MAEFAHMAGIQLVHVPYRGNAPAMTDLIAGRIQLASSSIGQFRPAIEAGKIRLLLTATKNRLPYLPDVSTSAEAGLPGYLMSVWIAVVAPAGTPKPVVDRIHALVQSMLKDEAAKKAMAGAGLDTMAMSQPEFAAFVKAEYARWENIVKDAGVEKQ
jgi:tripartite-type tricarboxylate transporter receptor subunit TctC